MLRLLFSRTSINHCSRLGSSFHHSYSRRVFSMASNDIEPGLFPPGAYDTHVHVFDSRLGPYHPSRAYTPAEAPLANLLEFLSSLNKAQKPTNIVLVQPSPYKTDNRVLLAALDQLRPDPAIKARGIAVVDLDTISDTELKELHSAGVRGLRLNLQSNGHAIDIQVVKKNMQKAADMIKHLPGWMLQLFGGAAIWDSESFCNAQYTTQLTKFSEIHPTISALPVQVIADHVGGLLGSSKLPGASTPEDALSQPGFSALLDLARSGRVIIKVSALYRCSDETDTGYADMAPIISKLAQEAPDSLIWASDWPHTGEGAQRVGGKNLEKIEEFRKIDDAKVLSNLREWVGDEDVWHKMMVVNPTRLFN